MKTSNLVVDHLLLCFLIKSIFIFIVRRLDKVRCARKSVCPTFPFMSLEINAKYITPKCILLRIKEFQILLDVPSLNQVEELEVDWEKVDYILVSNYTTAASIVYITEYTKFSGFVFATEPTVAYSRYNIEQTLCLIHLSDCYLKKAF